MVNSSQSCMSLVDFIRKYLILTVFSYEPSVYNVSKLSVKRSRDTGIVQLSWNASFSVNWGKYFLNGMPLIRSCNYILFKTRSRAYELQFTVLKLNLVSKLTNSTNQATYFEKEMTPPFRISYYRCTNNNNLSTSKTWEQTTPNFQMFYPKNFLLASNTACGQFHSKHNFSPFFFYHRVQVIII